MRFFTHLFLAMMVVTMLPASARAAETIERVSVAETGEPRVRASGRASRPSISHDGRFVAFSSSFSDLVSGDTNDNADIFIRDRKTNRTMRISISSEGAQGNGESELPSISGDGRFVAFQSAADNLVADDTNGAKDVFVHDRSNGVTRRVNVSSAGEQANLVSGAYYYVGAEPAISANGRFIAFRSNADNLIPRTAGHFLSKIFLHDLETGETELVSVSDSGEVNDDNAYEPSVSADGRYVAFYARAKNLVDQEHDTRSMFVRDRVRGTTKMISVSDMGEVGNGVSLYPSISANGRYVVFYSEATNLVPDDTDERRDVFVYDLRAGKIKRVSVSSAGEEGNGNSWLGYETALSADGRYIAFVSRATNLSNADTNGAGDVYLRDQQTGETRLMSRTPSGRSGAGDSRYFAISGDGRFIAFESFAGDLVAEESGHTAANAMNVFVAQWSPPGGAVDRTVDEGAGLLGISGLTVLNAVLVLLLALAILIAAVWLIFVRRRASWSPA